MAEKMTEYDLCDAFRRLEEKLIDDLMNNLRGYTLDDADGNVQIWTANQLRMLETYRKKNLQTFFTEYDQLSEYSKKQIENMYRMGQKAETRRIIAAIRKGYDASKIPTAGHIEEINEAKLKALIYSVDNDFKNAKYAVMRQASDEYRKIIYDSQVGLNTGTLSYKEAVDMATKDFLNKGIQAIKYKNGSTHKMSDYCDMYLKTANKRAYLTGEGEKRQEYGLHLVIVGQRGGDPCECCLPYIGKVLVDDVWSGGTAEEAQKGGYTLLSEAMENGLYHPRCKDSHTTYFPEITELPNKITKEERERIEEANEERKAENQRRRNAERYKRLSKYSLQPEKKLQYKKMAKEMEER